MATRSTLSSTAPTGSPFRLAGHRLGLRVAEVARRAAGLVEVCTESVSLGILRPRDVERLVYEAYRDEPGFYDPGRYRPAFAADEAALGAELRALAPGNRLLDAFCGQGREARTLASHGFEVTGIDRLEVMIEHATRYAAHEGFRARFLVADFESYAAPVLYDVVYTSAWMYSALQGRACRVRFLQRCRSLCAPNGLVVISYKTRFPSQQLEYRVRHALARSVSILTIGNRSVELGDRLYYGLFWHHFDEAMLAGELQAAGFETLRRRDPKDGQLVFRVLRPLRAHAV